VLRIHDHEGRDLAGRIDGNALRGRISVEEVLEQFTLGERAFAGPNATR